MSYPYPQLVPLLQFHCAPDEYQRVIAAYIGWSGGIARRDAGVDYWQIIPSYTYAYCPVCGTRYHEPADTYSIRGWASYNFLLKTLYVLEGYYPTPKPCPHFVGLHVLLNLHDEQPRELDHLENNTGEVPYITPWYFSSDFESYVVLHALPICRIENDEFVPRYTVFSLTYFCRDPDLLLRHLAAQAEEERVREDPEYYPATVWPPGHIDKKQYNEALYDLARWAERGQLGWLDITKADWPLCLRAGMQLPEMYRQIRGRRWKYAWEKGRIEPRRWY